MSMGIHESNLTPAGYLRLTQTPGTPFRFDDIVPPNARTAILKPEGGAIRYRDDELADEISLTDSVPLDAAPFYYIGDLHTIQFISADAGAVLHVNFYKRG